MDFSVCTQCSLEIEGKGIHYRDHVFCSDECCEEFDEELVKSGEPDLDELDEEIDEDFDDDDLGYQDDDPDTEDDFLDDDFEISPDDF